MKIPAKAIEYGERKTTLSPTPERRFLAYLHLGRWPQCTLSASHPSTESAHIILSGEMTLTINGQARVYRAGDRCDVPAGIPHSADMGRLGCLYMIGERTT